MAIHLPVHRTARRAARHRAPAVDDQFPQWRSLPIRPVASEGTVNALFRIGDRLAGRFPLQPADPGETRTWLAAEAAAAADSWAAPFRTPEPVALGEPGAGYPLPWSVQTWLAGTPASAVDAAGGPWASLTTWQRSSAGSGPSTPRAVRSPAPVEGATSGTTTPGWRPASSEARACWTSRRCAGCGGRSVLLPAPSSPVMTHGDLTPGNVLVADGRLTGVIDVGGLGPADPALDLVGAWHLLDDVPRDVLRNDLGCDDLEWERGKAWAFQQSMGAVWYYRDSNPAMSRMGQQTLRRLLADTPTHD